MKKARTKNNGDYMEKFKLPKSGKIRCYHAGRKVPRTGEIGEGDDFLGFHCGTLDQTFTRLNYTEILDKAEDNEQETIEEYNIGIKNIKKSEIGLYEITYKKPHNLLSEEELIIEGKDIRRKGYDLIPYLNMIESAGFDENKKIEDVVSYVGLNPNNIKLINVRKVFDIPEAHDYWH